MRRVVQLFLGAAMAMSTGANVLAAGDSAAVLRASYTELRSDLEHSPFGEPVHLVSTETGQRLQGDIHAVLKEPFEVVRSGLGEVRNWCDILILHPNVTDCRLGEGGGASQGTSVVVAIGRQRTPVEFHYRVAASSPEYLNVRLRAEEGPLGTRDYRIDLEATPLESGRTYLRLVFSHAYGVQAQLAMGAYLRTLGRGKVGFTVAGHDDQGRPVYVDGLRGALERNAMRYYVCVAAFLQSLSAPPRERFEVRLRTWYGYAERYPRQLHEDPAYLADKRRIAATPTS